jgi:DNA-directed RNA polymerase specialized sigma24 family protein
MPLTLRESICRSKRLPRDDEVLMGRAELLAPCDRDLVDAVLVRGQPTSSIARLMGVTRRVVRDRVHRLSRLLVSRRFLDAARALPYLSPEDGALARLRFCSGLTHAQLCQRLGLTPHRLRRRLDRLSAQIATIRQLSCSQAGIGGFSPSNGAGHMPCARQGE